jgi:Ca2+-binding EF-hand superfamily protein
MAGLSEHPGTDLKLMTPTTHPVGQKSDVAGGRAGGHVFTKSCHEVHRLCALCTIVLVIWRAARSVSVSAVMTTTGKKLADKVFNLFDANRDGSIDRDELAAALRATGEPVSDGHVSKLLEKYDTDGDGTLSREEFNEFHNMVNEENADSNPKDQLQVAFSVLCRSESGEAKDTIPVSELKQHLTTGIEPLPAEDVERLFTDAKIKADDELGFDAFFKLMCPATKA